MEQKYHLIVLSLFVLSFCSISAIKLTENDQVIELQKGNYTLGELLEILEKVPNLNLSYNANNLPLDILIKIDQSNPTILQLTGYIENRSLVEVTLNENYLVFREKQQNNH